MYDKKILYFYNECFKGIGSCLFNIKEKGEVKGGINKMHLDF